MHLASVIVGSILHLPMLVFAGVVASTPATAGERFARVTYVAGTSIYVDAGRSDGLAIGDTLWVVRRETVVARLRVRDASSHSAACDTLETAADSERPGPGDRVRFVPRVRGPGEFAFDSTGAVASPIDTMVASGLRDGTLEPSGRSRSRFRGRVGLSLLEVRSDASRLRQPGLTLRLDGRDLAGRPVDLALDLRGRQTIRTGNTVEEARAAVGRLYRGAIAIRPGGATRVTLGRQSTPSFASVSLFDGILVESGSGRWAGGLLAGTLPDPAGLEFSTDIVQAGIYGSLLGDPHSTSRWTATLGVATSNEAGEPNRDFVFLQGLYQRGGTSVFLVQEIDVLRGWRRTEGEGVLSPTSTFLSARHAIVRTVGIRAGYDGRRNVRLYSDRLTPESEFDDRFRQGAWVGGTATLTSYVSLDAEVRTRFGSIEERGAGGTLTLEARRFAPYGARARGRVSTFRMEDQRTDLWSLGVSGQPTPVIGIDFSGGMRSLHDRLSGATTASHWVNAGTDITLSMRWMLAGMYEFEDGDLGDLRQSYLTLGYRF
jgi:hypothetical protein